MIKEVTYSYQKKKIHSTNFIGPEDINARSVPTL